MKKLLTPLLLLTIATTSISCEDPEIATSDCGTHAVVEDWTELDGCGFLFKLDNGEYLEPIIVWYCGTPPISEDQLNDPLKNFTLSDGQHVMINYEINEDFGSICMKGTMANITCISEIPEIIGD